MGKFFRIVFFEFCLGILSCWGCYYYFFLAVGSYVVRAVDVYWGFIRIE